ncbi:DUF7504 family protein [Natronomonas marina]|jgi:hypothetical protein|uniref:DUF7504 family protein n=1 Tax=Natronomonas marina TaxID=2961939 RepID=UPI0020C9AE70|nr:hypothetical protein [Natronomonas marina]
MDEVPYEFDRLPLSGIRPGTTVLLTGPRHEGARELGLQLLAGPTGEGAIVITTNQRAERIADDCERIGIQVSDDDTAILDCVGDEDAEVPARVLPVAGPSDLTGIGMRFSDVYVDFRGDDIERVRTGLFSLSTLLSFGDLQTVSRFVHTLVGRIDSVDGLGVFLIDPASHDEQTVRTLSQFCNGRIEVRETDGDPELRSRGLPEQPDGWLPFTPTPR